MLHNLFILMVFVCLVGLGARAPFILALTYVWTDFFFPQLLTSPPISTIPFSLIAAAGAFGLYLMKDRRDLPKLDAGILLPILFAVWITITMVWAVAPAAAWQKWTWAPKTVAFAAFLPFVIRSRVQIEALLLTVLFAISGDMLAAAPKTLLTGGGYDKAIGLYAINTGLGESSFQALLSVAMVPILMYMKDFSVIFPKIRSVRFGWLTLITVAVISALGTFARTGLVALAMLAGFTWTQSKRKVRMVVLLVGIGALAVNFMPASFWDRMDTIKHPHQDDSAEVRLLVWQWTWNFVKTHPLGGGFNAFYVNEIKVPHPDGTFEIQHGRAFHSMYFEILGEQGYVGFGIWATMVGVFFWNMRWLMRRTRDIPTLLWINRLARAMATSIAIYLVGGTFIGIGFNAFFYEVFASSVALTQYYRRVAPTIVAPPKEVPVGSLGWAARRGLNQMPGRNWGTASRS